MIVERNHKVFFGILAATAVCASLYLTSLYSYLLFHSLVELAAAAVAIGMFILAWNSRRYAYDHFLLFLGIAFLFIAVLDLLHTLSYKGMGVFPGYGTNLPIQLWIAARYLQALSFLIAPVFLNRRLPAAWVLAAYSLLVALVLTSVFSQQYFPVCYVEGVGLTLFKKISGYVICVMFLGAIGLYLKIKSAFHPRVLRLLIISMSLAMASELIFTVCFSVQGLSSVVGYLLKLASYYLIYRAIIRFSLIQPYEALYKDLKQREEDLRNNQERLKAIYQNMPIPTYIWQGVDGDLRLMDFNAAAKEASESRVEKILGVSAKEVYSDQPFMFQNLQRCLNEKTLVRRETDYRSVTTGKEKHMSFTFAFVQPDMVLMHSENITNRKQAEVALRQSESRYNAIFLNNPTRSFLWQKTGDDFKLIKCNKSAIDFAEGKILKFVGSLASDFFHERPDLQDDMRRCFNERAVTRRESPYTSRSTGREIVAVHTFARIEPDLVLLLLEDITDLKQAEKALKQSEERLKALFKGGPIVTLIWQVKNGDFDLVDFNDEAERTGGPKIRQFLGSPASGFFRDTPELVEGLRQCREKKAVVQHELKYRARTSSRVYDARVTFGFVAPDIVILHMEDITERKKAEEERENLISELQKALAEVRALSGLLPICSNCKKIRDDQGYWQQLEEYIQGHSEAQFTHGICPECAKKLYPDLNIKS